MICTGSSEQYSKVQKQFRFHKDLARIKGGRERSKYDLLAFLFYRTCGN
jgi:hypothetical protein